MFKDPRDKYFDLEFHYRDLHYDPTGDLKHMALMSKWHAEDRQFWADSYEDIYDYDSVIRNSPSFVFYWPLND